METPYLEDLLRLVQHEYPDATMHVGKNGAAPLRITGQGFDWPE